MGKCSRVSVVNTGGDNWKSNGRVESCIGRLKGITTTLLSCAGLSRDDWPFAWRHGAERLLRNVLFDLGGVQGTKLLVRQRAWRISDWTPKAVPAVILAPARQVSKAWLVRTETGEYLTTAVIFPSIIEPPSKPEAQQGSETEEGAAIPRRRNREKTSVALLGPFEDLDSALASPIDADDEGSALESPGAEQERALRTKLGMDIDCPQVASCVICEVPGLTRVSGEIWEIPRGCSSNEELIRCEDAVAQSLATDPTYSLSRACEFVRRSLWGRVATDVLKGARRTELQRVLGLFRHGGVVGITNSTGQFPGFTRLIARMVQTCWPQQCFSSLALITKAEIPPHKDKSNCPNSNLILPLQLPKGGLLLWSEIKQGDTLVGKPVSKSVGNGQVILGQEQMLMVGQMAHLDARRWHGARANQSGPVLCVVAYTLDCLHKSTSDQRTTLTASGFRLPTAVTHQGGEGGGSGGREKMKTSNQVLGVGPGSSAKSLILGQDDGTAGCWCAERDCRLCASKFEVTQGQFRDEVEGGVDEVSDVREGGESWDEGSEGSWFLVGDRVSNLRKLGSESSEDETDWELVSLSMSLAGIPVAPSRINRSWMNCS